MADYPIEECAKEANKHVTRMNCRVHQKWTCFHCGSRQTMATPNTFYRTGKCEECEKVSMIEKCNYMLIMGKV